MRPLWGNECPGDYSFFYFNSGEPVSMRVNLTAFNNANTTNVNPSFGRKRSEPTRVVYQNGGGGSQGGKGTSGQSGGGGGTRGGAGGGTGGG
jgi:hypothetical protein